MRNDPTGRALQLLSLLQTRRLWRCAELAERLEVTERTVRRDIDQLRDLGYPVDATPGSDGGHRLAASAHLPPLVLDDDEAVAIAVGLRATAGAAIGGIENTTVQALAKIEQVLPDRLQRRVSALHTSVVSLRRAHGDDEVVESAPDLWSSLGLDARRVQMTYPPWRPTGARRRSRSSRSRARCFPRSCRAEPRRPAARR
jgi:predicted DNA-binding transcriptional regulator YafY